MFALFASGTSSGKITNYIIRKQCDGINRMYLMEIFIEKEQQIILSKFELPKPIKYIILIVLTYLPSGIKRNSSGSKPTFRRRASHEMS